MESADHYVNAFVRGKVYTIHGTISGFEVQMDPSRFARIHRTTIVNVGRIRELQSAGDGLYTLVLEDGSRHRIGRSFTDKLDRLRPRRRA
jgi:two-component system LytT family response regulator